MSASAEIAEDELNEDCARAACVAAWEGPDDMMSIGSGKMARWRCYLLLARRVRAIMATASAFRPKEAA